VEELSDGEWYLGYRSKRIPTGALFRLDRRLSRAEVERLSSANDLLSAWSQSHGLAHALELNRNEFLTAIVNAGADFYETRFVSMQQMEFLTVEFSRLFTNMLVMFGIFVEHTQKALVRRHGREAAQTRQFLAKAKQCFDASAAYRVFSKLRNYCAHYGVPPLVFQFLTDQNDTQVTVHLCLIRDQILKPKDLFNAVLRKEISEMPEEIPLLPLVEDWDRCFLALRATILDIDGRAARDAAQTMIGLRDTSIAEDDVMYMAQLTKASEQDPPGSMDMTLREVPEALARDVLKSILHEEGDVSHGGT